MRNSLTAKMVIVAFSLLLLFNLGVSARSTDCSKMTDAEIIEAIQAKIKVKYASQMNHVNVRIAAGVVTVEGWVTTARIKADIEKIIKKVKCVKSVVSTLTVGVSGGCGAGTKACGDICIPISETCNIKTKGE